MRLLFRRTRRQPELHTLHVLNHTGDKTLTWDPADELTTARVRDEFNALVAMGYLTYEADPDTDAVATRTFNPEAKVIVARRQMCGG